jgi:indole-3-glycerol phosphate synthase
VSRAFLSAILDATRRRLAALEPERATLEREAAETPPGPDWCGAFGGEALGVIAEIKRRSPSAGEIAGQLSPAAHARAYVAGGAVAVSVLTEEAYFAGSLADLAEVRRAVAVPLLRKDFVLDEIQLYEARIHGASAVLLIARILDPVQLRDLAAAARELELCPLIEVHSLEDLEAALAADAVAIGVNARDLETFTVNRAEVRRLLAAVPAGILAVAESGLQSRADLEEVAAWGADAVLVGAFVASAPDPEQAVRSLAGVARRERRASG